MSGKYELSVFDGQLSDMGARLAEILPAHISIEVFRRTVLSAVQHNPKLLELNRNQLLMALYDAASDGLLPDGYEGAIVPRKGSLVWQPMVWGIIKLARQAGLKKFIAHIVYEGEAFRVLLGDEDRIEHERDMSKVDMSKAVAVYGIAHLGDGTIIRRHMTAERVLKIKALGAPNGPWGGPFQDEMWIKTALHFLAKWIPLSSSVDEDRRLRTALDRDLVTDENAAPAIEQAAPTQKAISSEDRLDMLEALLSSTLETEQQPEPVEVGKRMAEPIKAAKAQPEPVTVTEEPRQKAEPEPTHTPAPPVERDPKLLRWVEATEAEFASASSIKSMFRLIDQAMPNRDFLREEAPELDARIAAAIVAANARLKVPA